MAFLYRYINYRGWRMYYGLVYGDPFEKLVNRVRQHKYDPDFDPSWRIEFIDGLTRTDVELLETVFINNDGEHLINKNKLGRGPTTIRVEGVPEWKDYKTKAPEWYDLWEDRDGTIWENITILSPKGNPLKGHIPLNKWGGEENPEALRKIEWWNNRKKAKKT